MFQDGRLNMQELAYLVHTAHLGLIRTALTPQPTADVVGNIMSTLCGAGAQALPLPPLSSFLNFFPSSKRSRAHGLLASTESAGVPPPPPPMLATDTSPSVAAVSPVWRPLPAPPLPSALLKRNQSNPGSLSTPLLSTTTPLAAEDMPPLDLDSPSVASSTVTDAKLAEAFDDKSQKIRTDAIGRLQPIGVSELVVRDGAFLACCWQATCSCFTTQFFAGSSVLSSVFTDMVVSSFGVLVREGAWSFDVAVCLPEGHILNSSNILAAAGWAPVGYLGALASACCVSPFLIPLCFWFCCVGNPLLLGLDVPSDPLYSMCGGIGFCGDSVGSLPLDEGQTLTHLQPIGGSSVVLTCGCDLRSTPRTMVFQVNGTPVGPPVPIPVGVTGIRPIIAARSPVSVSVDWGCRLTSSPLCQPLQRYIDSLRAARMLKVAKLCDFPLGVPVGRFAPQGLTVTGPVIAPDTRSHVYTIQRSAFPATKRFSNISCYVPGVCMTGGCLAYEVS